jgi:hypothetical protein
VEFAPPKSLQDHQVHCPFPNDNFSAHGIDNTVLLLQSNRRINFQEARIRDTAFHPNPAAQPGGSGLPLIVAGGWIARHPEWRWGHFFGLSFFRFLGVLRPISSDIFQGVENIPR